MKCTEYNYILMCHNEFFEVCISVRVLYISPQPEYQWNVLNQLPPHVQHKAHGKTTALMAILSCLHTNGIFRGMPTPYPAVLGKDFLWSSVTHITLIWWSGVNSFRQCWNAKRNARLNSLFCSYYRLRVRDLEMKTLSKAIYSNINNTLIVPPRTEANPHSPGGFQTDCSFCWPHVDQ